jgi:hypothetical protein
MAYVLMAFELSTGLRRTIVAERRRGCEFAEEARSLAE